jgi:hypothetical protein
MMTTLHSNKCWRHSVTDTHDILHDDACSIDCRYRRRICQSNVELILCCRLRRETVKTRNYMLPTLSAMRLVATQHSITALYAAMLSTTCSIPNKSYGLTVIAQR